MSVHGNATEAAAVRDRLIAEGEIVNSAREGQFKLWLPDDPEGTRSEPGTGLERGTLHLPDPTLEPTRSTVPALELLTE